MHALPAMTFDEHSDEFVCVLCVRRTHTRSAIFFFFNLNQYIFSHTIFLQRIYQFKIPYIFCARRSLFEIDDNMFLYPFCFLFFL